MGKETDNLIEELKEDSVEVSPEILILKLKELLQKNSAITVYVNDFDGWMFLEWHRSNE